MPQIEISSTTLALLKRHAEPLEDTYDSVITKFVHTYEAHNGKTFSIPLPAPSAPVEMTAKRYNASSPPDLTHTKILSAKLDGTALVKGANWANLLRWAIRKAKHHAKSDDDLRRLIIVNFVRGRKEEEGYKYLADVDLSVQGQDTNAAWRGIFHIAQQLGLRVDVVFLWRHKPEAVYPGETGRLVVGGTTV